VIIVFTLSYKYNESFYALNQQLVVNA